jgi:pSer/pThr/pTyr-binding forkhead associated (FHA) protein
MPLRLRVIPSTRPSAAQGKAPTAERSVEFPDDIAEIRIGRRPDLELPLPFSILSGVHAKLVRAKGPGGQGWFLEDLGSRNGTFLAGVRLPPGEKRPLNPGVQISLAHVDMVFEGPSKASDGSSKASGGAGKAAAPAEGTGTIARRLVADLFAPGAEASAPTVVIVSGVPNHRGTLRLEERDRRYVVGRVEGCDLRLAVEEISREHAGFVRKWNGVFVSDMGSKNGVRVNGVLAESQRVRDGDLIQIGPASLRLFDPEDRYLREVEERADPEPAADHSAASGSVNGSSSSHSHANGSSSHPSVADGRPGTGQSASVANARSAGARAAAASSSGKRLPGDLHPAIRAALALEQEPSLVRAAERTILRTLPSGAKAATLLAATVLAILAAVAVTLAAPRRPSPPLAAPRRPSPPLAAPRRPSPSRPLRASRARPPEPLPTDARNFFRRVACAHDSKGRPRAEKSPQAAPSARGQPDVRAARSVGELRAARSVGEARAPVQRRFRAFFRALRASLRLRFSLARSTLRFGAWKWPRSAEGVCIMLASWLTSSPIRFFAWASCLKPGILPRMPVCIPSCIISWRMVAN